MPSPSPRPVAGQSVGGDGSASTGRCAGTVGPAVTWWVTAALALALLVLYPNVSAARASPLQVTAGWYHSCALPSSGRVYCWGEDGYGQLGNGALSGPRARPVEVRGLRHATGIAAGENRTCAVLAGGGVDCWGDGDDGELGDGALSLRQDTPVSVRHVTSATQVTVGEDHTCALLSDGHVDCWGADVYGELGDGVTTVEPRDTPTEVTGISQAVQVSAGSKDTCALLADGHVECWGADPSGALGAANALDDVPIEVTGITDATQVGVGPDHACALLSDGSVDCWGRDSLNQLGTNAETIIQELPVAVAGFSGAIQLAVGASVTCEVVSDAHIDCIGDDNYGQLGGGSTSEIGQAMPVGQATPVEVQGIADAARVVSALGHTCAALTNGHVECWGENLYGEIGDGRVYVQPHASQETPVEVVGLSARGGSTRVSRHALPTLLAACTRSCGSPVFAVRPHRLECELPGCPGGSSIVVSWGSWGATRAVGAGTKAEMHQGIVSKGRVDVVASAPKGGHFTRLTLTFPGSPGSITLKMRHFAGALTWG